MIAEIFQRERFEDAGTARDFRAQSNARKFAARRFFLFAGVLLYSSYAYLDHLVVGPLAGEFIAIRLLLVAPVMAVIAIGFAAGRFEGYEGWAFAFYMAAMLGSVLYMCLTVGEPVSDFYAFGMVVIAFSMSMLLLPSLRMTVLMSLSVFVAFALVVTFSRIGPEALYANFYFIGMSCVVLVVGMFFLENTERRQYVFKRDLERTVLSLRESEGRAVALYQEAKQAERAKDEFLAVVSHELRTPMNAIIGFSEIISTEMMGRVEPAQYRDYAVHINKSGLQLLNIINDILDISRADIAKISFEAKPFDMDEAIAAVLAACSANATEADVTVSRVEPCLSDVMVRGDESRLMQALTNIVGNAIKFSEEGDTVHVDMRFSPAGELVLSVRDEGIGISPEDIEQIKLPFQQAESAFSRNNGGLGLGLAIANIVATAHEGELRIESALGEGTTVSIVLPPDAVVSTMRRQA